MPSEKDVCERLHIVTDRLSVQFRTFSVGVVIFCASLLFKEPNGPPHSVKVRLMGVALGVIAALAIDIFQLVCGYFVAKKCYNELQHKKKNLKEAVKVASLTVDYREDGFLFVMQMFFFWMKLALLISAVAWLCFFMTKFLAS